MWPKHIVMQGYMQPHGTTSLSTKLLSTVHNGKATPRDVIVWCGQRFGFALTTSCRVARRGNTKYAQPHTPLPLRGDNRGRLLSCWPICFWILCIFFEEGTRKLFPLPRKLPCGIEDLELQLHRQILPSPTTKQCPKVASVEANVSSAIRGGWYCKCPL